MAQVESASSKEMPSQRGRWARRIATVVAVLAAAAAAAFGVGVFRGDIAPADAAAKYAGFNYLHEDEVSDYIGLYREQMGLADATDADWAAFLASYNLTPARLRVSTIDQIVSDRLVQMKADELGIAVSEDEVDAAVGTLRDTLGLGDDQILMQTLAAHGQTEEGLREVYRQAILKRLVLSAEVPTPKPTDEQMGSFVRAFAEGLSDPTVKHSYCFRLSGRSSDDDRSRITLVQKLRERFAEGPRTVDEFASIVAQNSDDDALKANRGANGWDAGAADYGEEYLEALAELDEGGVSQVFVEGDAYAFIWVDEQFTFPAGGDALAALTADDVPASLWSYLNDTCAYQLWEVAGNDYLNQLAADAQVVYYPMPASVPYNVDMSLAGES